MQSFGILEVIQQADLRPPQQRPQGHPAKSKSQAVVVEPEGEIHRQIAPSFVWAHGFGDATVFRNDHSQFKK